MRHTVRFLGGSALLTAALVWALWGPRGNILVRLGPLPDLMVADLLTVPVAIAGLTVLAWLPEVPLHRRVLAVIGILAAVLWVTSELPWDDPVVPWLEFGRHGVHVLDVVALAPLTFAAWVLLPRRRHQPDRA